MAKIKYVFTDGHSEEVEVTEEFKREYEFLLVREQALHWKEMKQKEWAGLRCVKNLSLEKFGEDSYDLPAEEPDPLETLVAKEERREQYQKILSCLTEKQRQVYILFYIKGYKKYRLPPCYISTSGRFVGVWSGRKKRISKNFLKNSLFWCDFVHGYMRGKTSQ